MTKQEIKDKYGQLPNDLAVLKILLETELKTIGKLKAEDIIKELNDKATRKAS